MGAAEEAGAPKVVLEGAASTLKPPLALASAAGAELSAEAGRTELAAGAMVVLLPRPL